MLQFRALVAASLLSLFATQGYAEGGFKVRDFLGWERSIQDSYLNTTIITSVVIASQINGEFANCIGDWYSDTPEGNTERHDQILGVMARFEDEFPPAIVIAVIQRECGNFRDAS